MSGRYDDIINLPHHQSLVHKPMPMQARAAQFAPFAALTGHDEAIAETGRTTDARIELSADEQQRLTETLHQAMVEGLDPEVKIEYFIPDGNKAGGRYVQTVGRIRKLDEYSRTISLESGEEIPLDDIHAIRLPDSEG